ncbi:MAG: hypothetical protein WCI47_00230 [bacterium]
MQSDKTGEEALFLRDCLTSQANRLRLNSKYISLEKLSAFLQASTDHDTIVCVGDQSWYTEVLTAIGHVLAHNNEIILTRIVPSIQKLPRQLHQYVLSNAIGKELNRIAARKIVSHTVFSCGNQLFFDSIELICKDNSPTDFQIDASGPTSHYNVRTSATSLRLQTMQSPEHQNIPLLQLRAEIIQSRKTQPMPDFILSTIKRRSITQDREEVLHIPILKATIRTHSPLALANNPTIQLGSHIVINALPWELKTIIAKSTPRDID